MTDQTKARAAKAKAEALFKRREDADLRSMSEQAKNDAAAKITRLRALRRAAEAVADHQPITGEQIKAARKLLGWSAATLAIRSKRSVRGVAKAESSTLDPRFEETSLRAIRSALESAGVVLTTENGNRPGVRLKETR